MNEVIKVALLKLRLSWMALAEVKEKYILCNELFAFV